MDLAQKEYVVVVQCHLVKQRCSGYFCEKAFHYRTGGFAAYPSEKRYRMISLDCGGCCGRPLHRKLANLTQKLRQSEGIPTEQVVVQLSSCITKDNYHGPPCPHLDYLKTLVRRLGLDLREDTVVSVRAEERRKAGVYAG
ncbi:MAG: CGGC domain-containing protein [Armatimonadota bacterium]|jgi:predicted metal-binding protein|nr:CGGC domain-containing protein [Armatimonadota bacterium]